MSFFTDEYRCPAHAADVAAALSTLAARPDIRGPLNVAGPEADQSRRPGGDVRPLDGSRPALLNTDDARRSPGWCGPGSVVLDSALAASLGLRCRSLAEALPHSFSL